MSRFKKNLLIIAFLGMLSMILWECSQENTAQTDLTQNKSASYVGSEACQSCHQEAYKDWSESHHFHAFHPAQPEFIRGDVSGELELDGVNYRFLPSDSFPKIQVIEVNSKIDTYTVKYTLGWEPLQQLVAEVEPGRFQVMRLSWNVSENKWFHQWADTTVLPQDWLHWTGQSQNWNSMCADCHVTDFKKNLQPESQSYFSTWGEGRVSCESCHGPASVHLELVTQENYSAQNSGFDKTLQKDQSQIQSCAPCHSRREKMVDKQDPTAALTEFHHLESLNDVYYHGDGQIREEDYVLGSFLSSEMYHNDVTCGDCHQVHSGKLLQEGNKLCRSCHEEQYDTPEHHFHAQGEGTQCVNCHMTGTTYMGNDFRRDHSFRIPRPDQSVKYGTPNACIDCHEDQSNEWAAKQVEEWYGPERKPHFSDLLLKGRYSNPVQWVVLLKDTSYPLIARVTALKYLAAEQPILLEKNWNADWNNDEAFKKAVYASLSPNPQTPKLNQLVLASTGDKTLSNRIMGKRKMLELPGAQEVLNQLDPTQKKEWYDYLDYNQDFRETRALTGHFHLVMGDTLKGIDAFLKAIQVDSLYVDPYVNAAIMYSRLGKNEEADALLDRLNRNLPENDYGWYLHGLLLMESGEQDRAEAAMLKAIELNPESARYFANLVTFYMQTGKLDRAAHWLDRGLKKHPKSPELVQLVRFLNNPG
ncbi:hypothetical protein KFE98_20810 [bacterium SCSIO 12741]|nr:hypothetical protein KFE98_20810 [bacterium SCSIO 12741]